uniref:Pleurocidin-like peptide GcSc4B7 n=1 Tax=Glyptocephalus cynoglossus TaxID=34819 RepID=Q7SZG9_GLYCY|nr:pleurocidin-like peptide GcSc4B7 [Glyptocephalus cynoglossus]
MKFTATFLVLFMVVLMAEPGEGFWGKLLKLGMHGIGLLHQHLGADEQQELDERSEEDEPNVIVFE